MSTQANTQRSTAETIDWLIAWLGLTESELRAAVDATPGEWTAWREGDERLSSASLAKLTSLITLSERLESTFRSPKDSCDWMRDANHYLEGQRPIELVKRGQPGWVDNALEVLDSGIFV